VKTHHWNQRACVAVQRECVSQLQQQYRLTEFGRCHEISMFTRNSLKFRGNTDTPRQRPNSAARLEIPRLAENCGSYRWRHKLPDLEVDGQTPLGHESTVTRMCSELFDACLSAAVVFKPLHKCHAHCVFLPRQARKHTGQLQRLQVNTAAATAQVSSAGFSTAN